MKKKVSDYMSADSKQEDAELRFPRRWVVIIGEKNSFSEIFSGSFSTRGLVTVAAGIFFVCLILAGIMIVSTPLRSILPGYLGRNERQTLELLEQRVDSMKTESVRRLAYMQNLRAVLCQDAEVTVSDTTSVSVDSVKSIPVDSLLPMSEAERKFIAEFDAREKYNSSILTPMASEGMMFQSPLRNIVGHVDGGGKSLRLEGSPHAPVDAIYRGTVVASYFDGTYGGTVIIQHPNEFISVVSGLGRVYAVRGEQVRAGSRIGTLPSSDPSVRLEMWHNGTEISPAPLLGL